MKFTETDIQQWADRTETRSLLPVLVRRLVRETTPNLTAMRFPGNDAVALPGIDGETRADPATLWVADGRAYWEMGCNQNPASKATGDYDKRVADLAEAERKQITFVFVTPRRWNRKGTWVTDRRARGDWKDVRVYDAVDIETWLEEAPNTRVWLAEHLGRHQSGLASPDDWYKAWASAASPAIPMRLIADRRGGVADVLLGKLRGGDRTVPIVADSRQEAVAYVVAALTEAGADDLLDRMTVVSSPAAVPGAGTGPKPILLLDLPHDEEPALGDRDRFQIVRPIAKGQLATREHIELPHVGAEVFRQTPQEVGLSRDEAERQAREAGHSVTVLRRRLSDDPAMRAPSWVRDATTARRLLPHALAGGWLEGEHNDDVSILALLADTPEEEVLRARSELSRGEDAPLAHIGNVTVTVSQIDALFAVGPHIEVRDLEHLFLLAAQALGERDPKLDLPEDEWWMANIHGKVRSSSGALLSGLGDTFGILAVYGDAICGRRLGFDLQGRIDRLVRDLLSEMTPDAWISIRRHLRPLAEAAPDAFLDCLEADLARDDVPIAAIMRCVGDAGFSQECLRTDLLWALEALAWSPRYFARAVEVTFQLCAFEAGDNYANTPLNTAKALFCDWVPSTTVEVADRMAVLRRLANVHREPVIEVCKSLIEAGPRFASRTTLPRWLPVEGDYDTVTNLDCWNARREASRLMLDLAPLSADELHAVIDAYNGLHPDDLVRLRDEVTRWAEGAGDAEKAGLAAIVRTERGQLEFRRDRGKADGTDDLLATLREMGDALRAGDPRQRHRWLFEQEHITWPALERGEADDLLDFRRRDELIQERRREALQEIAAAYGQDGVYAFALDLERPYIVAQILAGRDAKSCETVYWARRSFLDVASGRQAELFLRQTLYIYDQEKLVDIVGELDRQGLFAEANAQRRLGSALPSFAAGWHIAERMGSDVRTAYWANAQITILRNENDDDAEFVARRLLDAGRSRSAYEAIRYEPKRLRAETWLEILQGIIGGAEPDGPAPDQWNLVRILQHLDNAPEISDAQIAAIEWPFAKGLRSYGDGDDRRIWAIHRIIMRDPSEFIGLIRWLYRRGDDVTEADLEAMDMDQRQLRANMTWHVFHEWDSLPGTRDDGSFDDESFRAWSSAMLRIAEEQARTRPALSVLADCIAHVAKRQGFDDWLPSAVLDFVDRPGLDDLRRALALGVRNARGVTTRGCYDGGQQERELAKRYRELAAHRIGSHPRVAAMLNEIADDYEADGRRHDEEAELGERWHP